VTRPSAPALRRALLTLAALAALLSPLAAAAPAARAVDAPLVTVQLTSIEARGTKPKHRVIVKATITNTGTVPAYGVQAMLWRSQDPITNLPTLREVAAGSSAWGSAMMGADQYRLITLSTVPFAPGETRTVRLRATLGELGFDARGAAYTIGVQVIGTGDQSSNYVVIGEDRTLLPLPTDDPVPVTSLVALTAPPSKLVDDLFADESLAAALTGRLDLLLEAAEAGRGYLVDTCLLDEVADMADGYQVRSGDAVVPGTGVAIARDWLARLERLPASSGARTLFGSPDVLGAQQAGNTEALGWSEAATDEVEALDELPLVALPPAGTLTQEGYAALAAADVDAVVATNTVRAGAWQPGATGVGVGGGGGAPRAPPAPPPPGPRDHPDAGPGSAGQGRGRDRRRRRAGAARHRPLPARARHRRRHRVDGAPGRPGPTEGQPHRTAGGAVAGRADDARRGGLLRRRPARTRLRRLRRARPRLGRDQPGRRRARARGVDRLDRRRPRAG
jgi:hypothetical protein